MARKHSAVGAHIFTAGGLARTGLRYAREIGAEAVQVFVSNPRGWHPAAGDRGQDEAFVDGCREDGLPVFIHAPYLVNFGSPTPATVEASVAATRHALRRGRAICARAVVAHAGAPVRATADRALVQVRDHVLPLLDELTDDDPDLLIEMTCGTRGALAADAEGLAAYLDALDRHPKVGVCIDTCHAHAAGHDLSKPGGMRLFLAAVGKAAGRGRVRLVHANDSRDAAGSGRDRHERIGRGTIGADAFGELFVNPVTKSVPVLIETAGSAADHAADLNTLKQLRTAALR